MFLFVLSIILGGVGLGALIASLRLQNTKNSYGDNVPAKTVSRIVAGVGIVLAVLMLFGSTATVVGTKNVGVITTFGHPDGYLNNGFHFTAPWQDVTELDDAVQTDTYASEGSDASKQQEGAVGTCIHVRIARQGTACVNVSIRWQIRPDGVDYLFRNFHDNAAIQDNLVLRDIQTAMNEAFVAYDPLGIDANGLSTNKPLSDIAAQVLKQVQGEVGKWVDVSSVSIPLLNFDGATQDKINQLQQQVAATRVASQAVSTAQQQAAANAALAASVNDVVLTDKCLNILKEAVDKGQALPAGFSCFGGSGSVVAVK